MKKIVSIFTICFCANISVGFGAYFYVDVVEQAIQNSFPEAVQDDVVAEYEAQMNPITGEINTEGMMNVCYAGGFDVSTVDGATNCANFVQMMTDTCAYTSSGSVYDKDGNRIANNNRRFVDYYDNPQTNEEKLRKCIVDKTVDWVIRKKDDGGGGEGGFQQTPSDNGNRVCCDEYGQPKKDENGNYLLGATNYGITTWASRLSVQCIKDMTISDAKKYYYTRHYMSMRYYLLPLDVQALLLEMSVSGIGNAGKAYICSLDNKLSKNTWPNYPVMTPTPIKFFEEWMATGGKYIDMMDGFKRRYTGTDLVNGTNCVPVYTERRKRAYEHLKNAYETCAKSLGIKLSKDDTNKEDNGGLYYTAYIRLSPATKTVDTNIVADNGMGCWAVCDESTDDDLNQKVLGKVMNKTYCSRKNDGLLVDSAGQPLKMTGNQLSKVKDAVNEIKDTGKCDYHFRDIVMYFTNLPDNNKPSFSAKNYIILDD